MNTNKIINLIQIYQENKKADATDLFQFCYDFCEKYIQFHNYELRKEDKEDIIQEVMLSIYKSIKTYDASKGKFTTWVGTILRNTYYKFLDKQRKESKLMSIDSINNENDEEYCFLDLVSTAASAEDDYIANYKKEIVMDFLNQMNPKYKYAIILKDRDGYSTKEIAAFMQTTESNVNLWRNRGKKQLREFMKNEFEKEFDQDNDKDNTKNVDREER